MQMYYNKFVMWPSSTYYYVSLLLLILLSIYYQTLHIFCLNADISCPRLLFILLTFQLISDIYYK